MQYYYLNQLKKKCLFVHLQINLNTDTEYPCGNYAIVALYSPELLIFDMEYRFHTDVKAYLP